MELTTVLDITVSPRSSKKKITIMENGTIKISISAPPVDGRANTELIALVAKRLKIPKSSIQIISGEKSRKKRIAIKGLLTEEIHAIFKGP
ncbi:MAG: YggU family protein [Chrysiogenales bacterium]|nr:MAG: YggU family protein [Chrysiogenales bacterium]